jgi:hypothetical protein
VLLGLPGTADPSTVRRTAAADVRAEGTGIAAEVGPDAGEQKTRDDEGHTDAQPGVGGPERFLDPFEDVVVAVDWAVHRAVDCQRIHGWTGLRSGPESDSGTEDGQDEPDDHEARCGCHGLIVSARRES